MRRLLNAKSLRQCHQALASANPRLWNSLGIGQERDRRDADAFGSGAK
jgi:hypothetical protein